MSGAYIQFFFPDSAQTIERALDFAKSRMQEYFRKQMEATENRYRGVIQEQMDNEAGEIDRVAKYVSENVGRVVWVDQGEFALLNSIIRSACDIYARDLHQMKKKTGVAGFDNLIAQVNQVLSLAGVKNAETGRYDKYDGPTASETSKASFFISYSTKDKDLAGKVANVITTAGADVFLAHDTIEVSAVWRTEILNHLISCSAMICIVTDDFRESEWTSQEAGFVMGRQEPKIISLILGSARPPGFLEAIQGVKANPDTLETATKEAIKIVTES